MKRLRIVVLAKECHKGEDDFISDLTGNFDDVVDVTIEAEALDIKDEAMFDSLLESAENAAGVKEVVSVAAEIKLKTRTVWNLFSRMLIKRMP